MRTLIVHAVVALSLLVLQSALSSPVVAQEGCTGENCDQQNQGGRDCERKKNDQTIS